MTEDERMVATDMNCSRCGQTIVVFPGDLVNPNGTISTVLSLDLIRMAIRHGFVCPLRSGA